VLAGWNHGLARIAVGVILFGLGGSVASAQFLRIGPFEFDASVSLEGIYTSNVDEMRPDAYKDGLAMEDFYTVASLDLTSDAPLGPNLSVAIDLGIEVEKHLNRDDLDTYIFKNPLGNLNLSTTARPGHYQIDLNIRQEATYEKAENVFTPSAESQRTLRHETDAGASIRWERGRLSWGADFGYSMTRYQDSEFQYGDGDTYSSGFNASWTFSKRLELSYDYTTDKEDLINQPDTYKGWNYQHQIDLRFMVLDRPKFYYALGAETARSQGEVIDWQPTHTFTLSDSIDFSKTVNLQADAEYKYAQTYAVDEIGFTCGLILDHEISRTASETLALTRAPAGTFGSTLKTDTSTVRYGFQKLDLFVYNLNFGTFLEFSRNKQKDVEEFQSEEIWRFETSFTHSRNISRKLKRSLQYRFSQERSNLLSEDLVEHRVTLNFTYTY
jgi:hypothetical protein